MHRRKFLRAAGAAGAAATLPLPAIAQGAAGFALQDLQGHDRVGARQPGQADLREDYTRFVRELVNEQRQVMDALGLAKKS